MTVGFNHLGQLGQLGNQMFQYAITKSVASKLNIPFKIPNHQNVFDDGIGNRYTILLFDIFKLESLTNFGFVDTQKYVQEKHFHYDETIFDTSPQEDFSLWGFFQSEKYFKDIEDEIRDDFKFKDELVSSCSSLIESVDHPIALHIRRGDFITNSKNHPPLPLDYYKRALKLFDDDRQVIIFSDDTKWCKEQEIFSDDRFLVSEDNDQSYDLCLMSMCNDFIIANSSFSWWGAWLGNRGKVVAPKQWFGKGLNHDTKDLYCSDWSVL